MKILFLVPRLDKASTRYRILQYLPYLEAAGLQCDVVPLSRTARHWLSLLRQIRRADCTFVQKKLFSPLELRLVRGAARRLVYDLDDAVMFKDGPATHWQQRRQRRRFAATVKRADLVVAGNGYLREQTLPFNRRVELLPTPIDLRRYTVKPAGGEGETVTLGWIGSRITLHYLQELAPVLEELGRRHPQLRLKIVADEFFALQQLPVIRKSWSAADEIADLHSFDIGLMPLRDDPWSRGKCGFKLLQCMAVGVPVVCSPVGMNTEIVRDGEEGFWAGDPQQWIERLEQLIGDVARRRQMGAKGRRTVQERYSLEGNAPRLLAWLREMERS